MRREKGWMDGRKNGRRNENFKRRRVRQGAYVINTKDGKKK